MKQEHSNNLICIQNLTNCFDWSMDLNSYHKCDIWRHYEHAQHFYTVYTVPPSTSLIHTHTHTRTYWKTRCCLSHSTGFSPWIYSCLWCAVDLHLLIHLLSRLIKRDRMFVGGGAGDGEKKEKSETEENGWHWLSRTVVSHYTAAIYSPLNCGSSFHWLIPVRELV